MTTIEKRGFLHSLLFGAIAGVVVAVTVPLNGHILMFLLYAFFVGLFIGIIDVAICQYAYKHGKWKKMFPTIACSHCGTLLPYFSWPQNMHQWFWGGRTCSGCGEEVNRKNAKLIQLTH